MFTAVWQAQVAAKRDLEARKRMLPPPPKTKHAIRPAPQAFTGDVVADYIARCEKGMTDQEINWILEDFRNAGLDFDWGNPAATIEQAVHCRVAQQRWYHDALVDGLRLSPEQSTQVAKKLDELFEKDKQEFLKEQETKSETSVYRLDISQPFYLGARNPMAPPARSPSSNAPITTPYLPWELCQLTVEQVKVTWKPWFQMIESKNLEISNQELAEHSGGPLFNSKTSFSEGYPIDESRHTALPNLIFPLLAQQKLIAKNNSNDPFSAPSDPPGLSALENVRLLHPCQLKALLMFNQGFSSVLQAQLDQQPR
jgi:hypothetical protein